MFLSEYHFSVRRLVLESQVVFRRGVDLATDPVGHIGRAGNLQEMAAALVVFHDSSPDGVRYYSDERRWMASRDAAVFQSFCEPWWSAGSHRPHHFSMRKITPGDSALAARL